jgi:hypothetical protein
LSVVFGIVIRLRQSRPVITLPHNPPMRNFCA